jgi:hypothetical protein
MFEENFKEMAPGTVFETNNGVARYVVRLVEHTRQHTVCHIIESELLSREAFDKVGSPGIDLDFSTEYLKRHFVGYFKAKGRRGW